MPRWAAHPRGRGCHAILQSADSGASMRGCIGNASSATQENLEVDSPVPDAFPTLTRGCTIGRNLVISVLGTGGMGVVYEAFDPQLGRRLAIKVVRCDLASDSEHAASAQAYRSGLIAEAQALAKISHPNVIAIYDVGEFDDQVFIAMEIIEGRSLRQWLEAEPRSWQAIIKMFLLAGAGLQAVHASGLVHRDFKPDNVLVGNDGRVCIADFGLAGTSAYAHSSAAPDTGGHDDVATASLPGTPASSEANIRSGTPSYMAPEMHMGTACDVHSDQFAFCVSLYESLLGQRPFSWVNSPDFVRRVQNRELRGPVQRWSSYPRRLKSLTLRGLSADPHERLPSLAELLTSLQYELDAPTRRWRQASQVAIGLSLCLALAGITQSQIGHGTQTCHEIARLPSGVWGSHERERLRGAFSRSQLAYIGESWATTQHTLDEYTDQWQSFRGELCESRRQAVNLGPNDQVSIDLKINCFESAKLSFQSLVDRLAGGSDAILAHSATAMFALPDLERCMDPTQLQSPGRPPTPGAEASEVASLHQGIVELQTLQSTGQAAAGLARSKALLNDALVAAPHYLAVHGEIFMYLSAFSAQVHEIDYAIDYARRALISAIASRNETIAAAAATLAFKLRTYYRRERTTGPELYSRARSLVAALGDPPEHLYLLYRNRVSAHLPYDDSDDRVEWSRRAVELSREAFGDGHPHVAENLMDYGLSLASSGRFERSAEMFAQSLDIQEDAFGKNHPRIALTLLNLALNYRDGQGRFLEALHLNLRAKEFYETLHGVGAPACAPVYNETILSLLNAGQLSQARRAIHQLTEVQAKLGSTGHPSSDWASFLRGAVELEYGDDDRALAAFDDALARLRAETPTRSLKTIRARLLQAVARVRLGLDLGENSGLLAKIADRRFRAQIYYARLAEVLASDGQLSKAREVLDRGLHQGTNRLGESPKNWPVRLYFAQFELEHGSAEAALEHAHRADDLVRASLGPAHHLRSRTLSTLASAQLQLGDIDGADATLNRGMAVFDATQASPKRWNELLAVQAALGQRREADKSR